MYETFEHGADVGVRGEGRTLEEAFQEGARAMFSVIVDIEAVRPERRVAVEAEAGDRELLFVQWLNNLLAAAHLEGMVFSRFEVRFQGLRIRGDAFGEPLDASRHETTVEVKGATLTALKVAETPGGFAAQCVVDV